MRNVYILLTDTGSLFTRLIKRFTNSPYNHVSIAFDKSLNTLYSFGRKHPYNPFWGGFVKESIYAGTFKRFKNTKCMLLKFEVSEEEYHSLLNNVEFFVEHENEYSYNLMGVVGAYFNKEVPRKNAYFCSEFVAHVLYQSNLKFWNVPPYMVRPYDFGTDDRFEVIYEGRLHDYATQHRNYIIQ